MKLNEIIRDVSIVIPNWNGMRLLSDYLHSVIAAAEYYAQETGASVEVIVVDDASTDASREWLSENFGGHALVRIIKLETNVGFLRAVNHGFENAKHQVVFLLNNDVYVEHASISPLVRHFEDKKVFAVCCRAYRIGTGRLDGGGKIGVFNRGRWSVYANYEVLRDADEDEVPEYYSFYGGGGYTAYDKEKWETLGGFQDCLAPIYWEDVEICYRAWRRGWTVLYEPESTVHHLGSATMGKETFRRRVNIVTERNRLLMTWVNLHDHSWLTQHIFWLSIKLLGSVITLDWRYLKSFFGAMALMPAVIKARTLERNAARVSDRELTQIFSGLVRHKNIFVIENLKDEHQLAEFRKSLSSSGP